MRSLMVLVFIAGVGAAAIYIGQRPTIARGAVLGARLLDANRALVKAIDCSDAPIGVEGARFSCRALLNNGSQQVGEFAMDRNGTIEPATKRSQVKHTSDPWGD